MGLGDSGGRSAGNRQGEGARRRFTDRERSKEVPSYIIDRMNSKEPAYGYQLTPRGEQLLIFISILSMIGLVLMAAFILYAWFII